LVGLAQRPVETLSIEGHPLQDREKAEMEGHLIGNIRETRAHHQEGGFGKASVGQLVVVNMVDLLEMDTVVTME
jgi:hypothetical protein